MTITVQDFDFSVNLLRCVLWQYDSAARVQSILQQKSDWYTINQEQFWADWVRDVFDLRTANDFGLSVWGIILGVPLQATIQPIAKANFGFGTYNKNFDHGTFGIASTSILNITTAQKRILLQLRYFKLISRCTVPAINRVLKSVLGSYGKAYVLDGNDMGFITYVFAFQPSSQLLFVLENFDILPRPAAVGLKYIISTRPVFGFGTFNKNFNHGTFAG